MTTVALPYTGERCIPWNGATGMHVLHHHVMRYAWALQFAFGLRAADLACGSGYGSYLLSWGAARVTGVDISQKAIAFARQHFTAANLAYEVGDITGDVPAADIYFAFECLEHLPDPTAVLALVAGRPLVWSMPIGDGSRYHARPYSAAEIYALMAGSRFYYQDGEGYIDPEGAEGVGSFRYILGVLNG